MTNHKGRNFKKGCNHLKHMLKIYTASIYSHETLATRLAPSKHTCRKDLPLMPVQSRTERTTARDASVSARRSSQDCTQSCTQHDCYKRRIEVHCRFVSISFTTMELESEPGLPLAGKDVSIQAAKSIRQSSQHKVQKQLHNPLRGSRPCSCTSSPNTGRPLPVARRWS